ncbi:hypothetical protein GCK72_002720 [Caenorhabditis remanei]|nr:hypothetical protein GCK72_002720 [Caenorhabditis remanei]KAF1770896.1 hypothetical protein GCK72_002720 [Caenorhabditis remanei]
MDIFSQEIIWKLKEIAGIRPIQILILSQLWKYLRNQHQWSKSAMFLHKKMRTEIQPVLMDLQELSFEQKLIILFMCSCAIDTQKRHL